MLEPPPSAITHWKVLYIKTHFDPISVSFLSIIFFLDSEMASPKFDFLDLASVALKKVAPVINYQSFHVISIMFLNNSKWC